MAFQILAVRATSRGLPSFGAFKRMMLERLARQNGSNKGGFAPSLQCLHKVCIVSAESVISTLDAHFQFVGGNKCIL